MSRSFDVSDAEWVTLGTVGEPGRRTFYLQLATKEVTFTLKLEKQQVARMSELLVEILSDLPAPPVPPPDPPELDRTARRRLGHRCRGTCIRRAGRIA